MVGGEVIGIQGIRSDRVPEKLRTEVCDIVQEAVIKTIPMKKAKSLSEQALQIAVNRREVKGKEEKERYTRLNAEFQRIARRDKKVFLSDQHKEIDKNNRMGKTRSSKKLESFRKTSALLTMSEPLAVWITTNCGKV